MPKKGPSVACGRILARPALGRRLPGSAVVNFLRALRALGSQARSRRDPCADSNTLRPPKLSVSSNLVALAWRHQGLHSSRVLTRTLMASIAEEVAHPEHRLEQREGESREVHARRRPMGDGRSEFRLVEL